MASSSSSSSSSSSFQPESSFSDDLRTSLTLETHKIHNFYIPDSNAICVGLSDDYAFVVVSKYSNEYFLMGSVIDIATIQRRQEESDDQEYFSPWISILNPFKDYQTSCVFGSYVLIVTTKNLLIYQFTGDRWTFITDYTQPVVTLNTDVCCSINNKYIVVSATTSKGTFFQLLKWDKIHGIASMCVSPPCMREMRKKEIADLELSKTNPIEIFVTYSDNDGFSSFFLINEGDSSDLIEGHMMTLVTDAKNRCHPDVIRVKEQSNGVLTQILPDSVHCQRFSFDDPSAYHIISQVSIFPRVNDVVLCPDDVVIVHDINHSLHIAFPKDRCRSYIHNTLILRSFYQFNIPPVQLNYHYNSLIHHQSSHSIVLLHPGSLFILKYK